MKKTLNLIILITLILSLMSVNTLAAVSFPDVKPNSWYYESVMALANNGGIEGYPDRYFRPNRTITFSEYLILAMRSSTGKDFNSKDNEHWAKNVYDYALSNNIINSYDFPLNSLDKPITRENMALILSNISVYLLNEDRISIKEIQEVIDSIVSISAGKQIAITDVHSKGIVGGKPTGFNSMGYTTRAEACATIIRLTDKSKRLDVEAIKKNIKEQNKNDIKQPKRNRYVYPAN